MFSGNSDALPKPMDYQTVMYNFCRWLADRVYSQGHKNHNPIKRRKTMAARGRFTQNSGVSDSDTDINLAGWDPYIVAITGGSDVSVETELETTKQATDSRESRLMAWLREHGA